MTNATPMMQQYLAARTEATRISPTCLLFYRMGDFYELFFDDAARAAAALDITLTKRGSHDGVDIPMCGVPVHAAETYLSRLIRKGFRVAVAEQMEDPAEAKKRGAKSVVRRDIVRVITPGTLTDDALLSARGANMLAGIAQVQGELALAWCDISTGLFMCSSIDAAALEAELARLDPAELLVPDGVQLSLPHGLTLTPVPRETADSLKAADRLAQLYEIKSLDGLGAFARAEIAASGALLCYLQETQRGLLPRLQRLKRDTASGYMSIDAATRASLELQRTQGGERKGSLLDDIDRTLTNSGARLLNTRLGAPLTDMEEISARLSLVSLFHDDGLCRDKLLGLLKQMPDIERALQRLALARGSPRDMGAVRDGLKLALQIKALLMPNLQRAPLPPLLTVLDSIGAHGALLDELERALVADLPLDTSDGGFIIAGYDASLDELRLLSSESRRHIAALEAGYREATGNNALKIRHNNIIGYHLEVNPKAADALMRDPQYIHRQTMANAVRFSTMDLNELAQRIAQSGAKSVAIEVQHFERVRQLILTDANIIAASADAVAQLDVASALAARAAEQGWARPLVDNSVEFKIEAGRHPVVETALQHRRQPFMPNHIDLEHAQRLWLITGPNMAGKSTFLRQNALIAVLAQMGSFVPAKSAHIGIVDRLFSRVGASDDLAQGRSTFMVEMVETAAILNQAGPRALVVLDEVGRGTATYDGLSIAWAALEHLHDVNGCRTLFATHYHELTTLADRLGALALYTVKVKAWNDELIFLHEIAAGRADRSYGLQVAKMAGLPQPVLARAQEVLDRLEQGGGDTGLGKTALTDLPLFTVQPPAAKRVATDALREALASVHPDELTPRAALDALYKLKGLA
jgi:DNA mismatch repair protein MutS